MIYTAKVFEEGWKSADFRVHDFGKLIELADLGNELEARLTASRATGGMFHRHWEKVKAWKPESRYQPRTEADARALLDAITHKPDGVLRWLKNYW
jgi:hypothetical protein